MQIEKGWDRDGWSFSGSRIKCICVVEYFVDECLIHTVLISVEAGRRKRVIRSIIHSFAEHRSKRRVVSERVIPTKVEHRFRIEVKRIRRLPFHVPMSYQAAVSIRKVGFSNGSAREVYGRMRVGV